MRYIDTDDGYAARYVPENEIEAALLTALIRLTLGGEWKPIRTLRGGDPSGWEFRLELKSGSAQNEGIFDGYLTTKRADFDPVNFLDGEAVSIELWVEGSPYWAGDEPRIYWRVPATQHGHAQENYLPHLPVLMAE